MRRVMCVWCPIWPVQRLQLEQPELRSQLLSLFAEGRRGLQVVACSPVAHQQGVRVGMPLGEAQSLRPKTSRSTGTRNKRQQPAAKFVWKQSDPVADRVRLQALALHCQRFSPLVGLEEAPEPESLWLDISGSEVLFGGEQGLVETLRMDLAQQGIQSRVAIADTWGAAWAVSHFAEPVVSLIPPAKHDTVLAPLPVMALRIPQAIIDQLRTLEILTIEQLMRLPRETLPSRFGKELGRRLDQALGQATEILTAEQLAEPVRVELLFEEPVTDQQTLQHVCGTLLKQVLEKLETRRAGLRELICHWLGSDTPAIRLRLWRPSTDQRHLHELLRLHSERCRFTSGVKGVRLDVIETGLPLIRQATLFDDEDADRQQRSLAELVDRLSSRLGTSAVLRPVLQPDPLPEFSCHHQSWLEAASASQSNADVVHNPSRLRCRPLQLLHVPRPLAVDRYSAAGWPTHVERSRILLMNGPERIESGWWRDADARRDYFRIDLASGTRLWAFRDRSSGSWFLHGIYS